MKFNFTSFIVTIIGIGAVVLIVMLLTSKPEDTTVTANLTNMTNTNLTNLNNITNTSMSDTKQYEFPGQLPDDRIVNKKAIIEMDAGNIEFEFYETDAPKTVSNFIYLAEEGYFDGLTFHRVEPGFVIQGGDPDGVGTGGPGYKFEDETVTKDYEQGIVAMANSGPNTNGSQFFIMLEDKLDLPKNYTIFGKVTSGMDVVSQVQVGDIMNKIIISDK